MEKYGLKTYRTYDQGKNVQYIAGTRGTYEGTPRFQICVIAFCLTYNIQGTIPPLGILGASLLATISTSLSLSRSFSRFLFFFCLAIAAN